MAGDRSAGYQIGLLFLGALLTLASSYIFWCAQMDADKQHIAYALYNEIDTLEETVVPLAYEMNNRSGQGMEGDQIPQVIYSANGAYYDYRKEVSSLDKNLAHNISQFYNTLIAAENDRQVIMDIYIRVNNNTPENKREELDEASVEISQRLEDSLTSSAELLPSLKGELEDYLEIDADRERKPCPTLFAGSPILPDIN
ncbi:MAG: hypothetical protein QCH35_08020 [Methanomicrobiaceae archaeon]|nr:hypothetical protein [Methanomicrobiaceae archaeon]